ncbi:MAG: hypothetical protein BWY68_00923 [bacterium ADurb.Bin400]|nr:MAG: hypothetical protein BWY68_00923 [bacterium ADurb.Bin400]
MIFESAGGGVDYAVEDGIVILRIQGKKSVGPGTERLTIRLASVLSGQLLDLRRSGSRELMAAQCRLIGVRLSQALTLIELAAYTTLKQGSTSPHEEHLDRGLDLISSAMLGQMCRDRKAAPQEDQLDNMLRRLLGDSE